MTDFLAGQVAADQMVQTSDIAALARPLLTLSPGCTIPELIFEQTGFKIGQVM